MFYIINKPCWISSFWVLKVMRKKLNTRKIWHTWTLDPLASWVLIVATWNSTKLIPYLEKKEKTYVFSFNIDWSSPTLDLEWEVNFFDKSILENKKKVINEEWIKMLIKERFSWKIKQTPPVYSAIKIDWKRAYEMAREWIEVNMQEREIEISAIKLLDYNFPTITIEATVSAWTYIRTLAWDIAKSLWLDWYVTKLHRSKIWNIQDTDSILLDDITKENNTSETQLFPEFWIIEVDDKEMIDIKNWIEITYEKLKENKKYFIVHKNIIESLVEIRNHKTKILRNNLS